MEHVTGRTADFLIKPDGTRIAGISLIENTLTKIPGIDQMQIVQQELNHITLKIVPGDGYGQGTDDSLMMYFQNLFGSKVLFQIEIIEIIEPEASGKYRFSICNVK